MQGKFIVFEGIDGCGKTTQLKHLHEWLDEVRPYTKVCSTREPGGTRLGEEIRRLLDSDPRLDLTTELFLFLASRSEHARAFIKPMLTNGAWVLSDRYADSTIAYYGYGECFGQEETLGILERLNSVATMGVESDLTLWIDADPEIAMRRVHSRQMIPDSWGLDPCELDFCKRVQAGYRVLAANATDRIIRIDGNGAEEEVAQRIREAVGAWMEKML